MYGCLFVVAVLLLGLFTARSKGQSFGYVLTDLKLVRRDKREAMALNLIMRQALGIGIPLMILGYFFGTLGILAWWLLNGIIVLITPNQQSLFDLVFGLVTVNEPEINITFDNKNRNQKYSMIFVLSIYISALITVMMDIMMWKKSLSRLSS